MKALLVSLILVGGCSKAVGSGAPKGYAALVGGSENAICCWNRSPTSGPELEKPTVDECFILPAGIALNAPLPDALNEGMLYCADTQTETSVRVLR